MAQFLKPQIPHLGKKKKWEWGKIVQLIIHPAKNHMGLQIVYLKTQNTQSLILAIISWSFFLMININITYNIHLGVHVLFVLKNFSFQLFE